jgi:hypothetical protein
VDDQRFVLGLDGGMSRVGSGLEQASGGSVLVKGTHSTPSGFNGYRSVLAIISSSTQTVGAITVETGGAPGGWTVGPTHTAQGRKLSLFHKICGPTEAYRYNVALSPATPVGTITFSYLVDFITTGAALRAQTFADAATGTTLTFSSLTVSDADDIWAVVWCDPVTGGGTLKPQPPLSTSNHTAVGPPFNHTEDATQAWQSNAPTGTRSYQTSNGISHEGAIGVMMIVGEFPVPDLGGWGVGMVRMGAN